MNVGGLLWLISCGSPLFCTMITGRILLLGITMLAALACVGLQAAETKEIKFADPPHSYYTRPPQDAFTLWSQRFQKHEVQLDFSSEKARLVSLLKALDVPVTSQLLVYSATSLQAGLIRPSNPRALYFNEEVYVGYVPGGKLEIAAIDPELGPIFSIFNTTFRSGPEPEITRTERCMNCHAGNVSWRLPGFTAESVIALNSGGSLDGFRRDIVGHTIPISDRLGGWHVTGAHEKGDHHGNLLGVSTGASYKTVPNPPGSSFEWDNYPVRTSDLFTHLIHEHQLGFHNLVTLAVYRTREFKEAGHGMIGSEDATKLNDIARQLVRYILFANEAKLPSGGVKPDTAFVKDFTARRKPIANGASLRDLDLRTRLFKYRCSYLVHTKGFAALPREIKDRVLAGLATALREQGGPPEFNYLPPDEKRAIRTLLKETKLLP
jgi:hypothetical protein